MKRIFLLFVFVSAAAYAQQIDNFVTCAPYYDSCVLTINQPWSSSNLDWRFPLYYPGGNLRVYFVNHNTTNGHTLTPKIWLTADTNTSTTLLTNADKWVQGSLNDNTTANAKCSALAAANAGSPGVSGAGTCYTVGLHARQVAIQVTGAASAAGSPDTFDLIVVESPSYIGGPNPGQDSSVGGQLLSNTTPADATSNTTIPGVQGMNMIFNGTTWDRWRTSIGFTDGVAGIGLAGVTTWYFNGSTWDKVREPVGATLGDANTNTATVNVNAAGGLVAFPSYGYMFNGTTWDRLRGSSTTGLATGTSAVDSDAQPNTAHFFAEVNATTNSFAAVVYPHVFNGTTWDRLHAGGSSSTATGSVGTIAVNESFAVVDGAGNTIQTPWSGTTQFVNLNYPYIFNGTTWDRSYSAGGRNGDANAGGGIGTAALYTSNGTTFDRVRGAPSCTGCLITSVLATDVDSTNNLVGLDIIATSSSSGFKGVAGHGFNGSSWDRLRTASLANQPTSLNSTTSNSPGIQMTEKGPRWAMVANPLGGSAAVANLPAAANTRHVIDCFSFAATSSAATVAIQTNPNVQDGANVIWGLSLNLPAAGAAGVTLIAPVTICGLNIVGTTNTAMSCSINNAVAGFQPSVSCSGYDIK